MAKDKQEAKDYITEKMAAYDKGEKLDERDLSYVMEVNHHIKFVNGQTVVTWNGKEYVDGSDGFAQAIAANRLLDAGIELEENWKPEDHTGETTVTTTTIIGSKEDIKVESDGYSITFYSPDGTGYASKDALLHGEY